MNQLHNSRGFTNSTQVQDQKRWHRPLIYKFHHQLVHNKCSNRCKEQEGSSIWTKCPWQRLIASLKTQITWSRSFSRLRTGMLRNQRTSKGQDLYHRNLNQQWNMKWQGLLMRTHSVDKVQLMSQMIDQSQCMELRHQHKLDRMTLRSLFLRPNPINLSWNQNILTSTHSINQTKICLSSRLIMKLHLIRIRSYKMIQGIYLRRRS